MSAPPFIQLYVGDYLADTLDLTTEQHGAYLLLLMTMWRHGGGLPNDAKKLARIARATPKRWPSIWAEIAHFFYEDEGEIRNRRLDQELQKAVSISQKRKTAGERGGRAKALKQKNGRVANATDLPKHSQISESDNRRETNVSLPPCIPPTGDDRHDDDSAPASDQHAQNPEADPTGDARAGDGESGGGGGGQPAADRDQREGHPRPAAKRKTQFPADWWPSEAGMLYAIERGCPDIAANVAACVDHHRARGNVFLDHAAAWRTWCRGAGDRFGWAGGGAAVDSHRGRGAARDQRPSARNSAYHRMLAATAQSGSAWPETGDGGADW